MALKNLLRENEYAIRVAHRRWRQKLFVARVKAVAKWERATVEFDFAPDVQIGRNVRVVVWPGTHTTFKLGPKSWLRDNVVIHMKGGSFVGGLRTDLRQNVAIQIEGRIILDGENTISYGCSLHSGESIHLGYAAIMAEYATIADSTHFHTTPDEPVGENVKFAAVEVGRNTFICPRVSVGRGVTIGPWSIVGPSSVVSHDIPAGVFASGVPAEVVRALDHPWLDEADPEWPSWTKHHP
ncbi:MAG: acyltransferase [Acidimicrobiales bacterium]|nr:acyltransferase [Acidimicrobiales bacterium]